MIRVFATREGRVGYPTAFHRWPVSRLVPFVALPSVKALGKAVLIRNELNQKTVEALVLDVGPWNEHDDDYVFGSTRPAAESGVDTRGRVTNKAGIDLGEYVWHALGMTTNGPVSWCFATYNTVA